MSEENVTALPTKRLPSIDDVVVHPKRWRRLDEGNHESTPTWLTVFSYYDFKSEVRLSYDERRWTVRAVKVVSSRRSSGPAWLRERLNEKECSLLWQHFKGPLSVLRDARPDEEEVRVWREVL